MLEKQTAPKISVKALIRRFWKKTILTWLLVMLEGTSLLFMPLVIGWAVDDLMLGNLKGTLQLAILCMVLLIVGAGRRFYDTRAYSGIYSQVSNELVAYENDRQTSVSKISARANLFTEFIEFLENSLPDVINQLIGLVGTLFIIAFMNIRVFGVCMAGTATIVTIYLVSQNRMLTLNKGQNDEFECQVDLIAAQQKEKIKDHFRSLMTWRIKLSDLETINFSLTWVALAGVLILSIAIVATSGVFTMGQVLSVVMYVFGFLESVMAFPLYYQQLVRLREIAIRLAQP